MGETELYMCGGERSEYWPNPHNSLIDDKTGCAIEQGFVSHKDVLKHENQKTLEQKLKEQWLTISKPPALHNHA